ncbi:MAG: caspase family protein [Deltaproteobacteria bacterium]|nr:caspase family protein [Deltaproteobacteria bacterium]
MKKLSEAICILLLLAFLAGCAGSLQNAAYEGDLQTITKLINDGANINENSAAGPALHYACYTCQLEAVKLLLGRGANVNIIGFNNWTAMHAAAWGGCNDVIGLLIDKGAGIDPVDDRGYSPLAWAADRGNASVKFLIEKGADPDIAINGLIRQKNNAAARIVEQAAMGVQKGKTQIATNKESRSPAVKSDVDDLPAIKTKPNKNSYAIVIGIEQYRQKLPKADFAVSDAKLVSEYLSRVMGFPEENIVTLTNEHATKSDFEKYFEKWLSNNAEKDSTVFIYYSGHGAPNPKTGDAYLVPYDGDPSFIDQTGYSLKRLYESLNKLQTREIIVVLDSCFSGAGGRSVLAKGARPLVMNLQNNMALSKNMTVLSASSGEQISSTYDEKGHGLFTYFMLKGIKNEDVVQPDGSIAISDLFNYLKPQVERIARKQYNNEQTPQLIGAKKN